MPQTRKMSQILGDEDKLPPTEAPKRPKIPKTQKLINVKRHQEKLTFRCQWLSCSYSTRSMEKFNAHVGKHVPVCLDGASMYERCHWATCDHHSSEQREMRRHVLYHAYHARLMTFAANVQARNALRPCTLDSSERHVLPELLEPFTCAWDGCNVEFDDPQAFFWHAEHHVVCHYKDTDLKDPKGAKCLWEGCTMAVRTHCRLKDHVRTHTTEKYVACPGCGNVFANNQKFADHCKRQAPLQELRFQCSHCLKLYPSERLLRDHIRHHINSFRCSFCGMTLSSPYCLRKHINFRHTEEQGFSCPKCPQKAKTAWDMQCHIRRHEAAESGERVACPEPDCRFTCLQQSQLKAHFRNKHSSTRSYYFCHLCDARFLKSHSITGHLKKCHHLEVPQGHSRFSYRRDQDGHFRLQTLRYESLEVAEQAPAGPGPATDGAAGHTEPDVLALSCQEGDVPDTITTDDGRELQLPDTVRNALGTGRRVLVCVQGEQVQLLARMEAMDELLGDPDDPDALMMVVDEQAVAAGPAEDGPSQPTDH